MYTILLKINKNELYNFYVFKFYFLLDLLRRKNIKFNIFIKIKI